MNLSLNCKQAHLIRVLLALGLEGMIKNLLIFVIYGFFTALFITVMYGMKKDLPDSIEGVLTGPISYYTLIVILIASTCLLLITSRNGNIKCDFEKKRPKRMFYFSIPLCEASISIGVVMCGALLGIAIALNVASIWDDAAKEYYASVYALSLFSALSLYPFILLFVSILDQENKTLKQSATFNLIYVITIFLYSYYTLPLWDTVISSGVIFVFSFTVTCINAYRKHNN